MGRIVWVIAALGCGRDAPLGPEVSANGSLAAAPVGSIVGAGDFRFRVDDFNWEFGGSELITLGADGNVEHVDAVTVHERGVVMPKWFRERYLLPKAQVYEFQRLLVAVEFERLDEQYVNAKIFDGVNTTYALDANGKRKLVHCSNEFPSAVREVEAFIRSRVLGAAPKNLAREPLTHQQAQEIRAARWPEPLPH